MNLRTRDEALDEALALLEMHHVRWLRAIKPDRSSGDELLPAPVIVLPISPHHVPEPVLQRLKFLGVELRHGM